VLGKRRHNARVAKNVTVGPCYSYTTQKIDRSGRCIGAQLGSPVYSSDYVVNGCDSRGTGMAVHEVIAVDDDDKGNTKTRGSLRVGYHAENEGLTVLEFCRQIM
jgi:hypothetical protein